MKVAQQFKTFDMKIMKLPITDNFIDSPLVVHPEPTITAHSPIFINKMDRILCTGTSLVNFGIFLVNFTCEEIPPIHFFYDRELNLSLHTLNRNPS